MNLSRTLFATLICILVQILAPAAAQAKWLRAETQNFVIYSDGSDKQLRQFATQLERFDATARWSFEVKPAENPNKLTVYFLASQEAVSKLAGDKSGMLAGFYSPREEGTFAVAHRSKSESKFDLDGMTVLFHEYAHHFMFRHFTYAYPAWYVEGFAEYLSTATFDDKGGWTLGKPAYYRANSLLNAPRTPVNTLLFGKFSDLKPAEVGPFYGRSWLLVHMLSMKPEYKGKLKNYFDLVGSGKTPQDAATQTFGDLTALDRDLDQYLGQRLRYIGADKPIPAATNVSLTELSDISGKVIVYRLKRLRGTIDPIALDALRNLAEDTPGEAEVWFELAKARQFMSRRADGDQERRTLFDKAEAAVDHALAANPNHVRANVLKAQILFERLKEAREFNAEKWTAARQYLITANKAAVDDPLVLAEWYDSFKSQGRQPSLTARDGLFRAFELAPEVTEFRVKLALDLASQGKYDQALGLVEFLAQHPHHADVGRRLVEHIKSMRDRSSGGKH